MLFVAGRVDVERGRGAAHLVPSRSVEHSASGWRANDRRQMVVGLLLTFLMLTPCVVAIASLAGRSWWPVDDFAIIDLRVRDVWSLRTPLTGLYSRPGWNHPGPLMFWLMSLVSLPSHAAPWATRIGGALLQGVALGWLAWLAWRRGLRVLLAAAVVTAATYHFAGPLLLREPWNPNVPIAFFTLFLFLAWFVATGSFRLLIAMVLVGSFAVQTHVSYTLLVIGGFAWAIGCTLVDARREHRTPPQWRSTVLVSALVGMLCWSAPAVDVMVHPPGNLGKIGAYFVAGHHKHVGLGSATRIMASEFRILPPWAGGREPMALFSGQLLGAPAFWLLGAALLLGCGALAARVTGSRDDRRLLGLATLMLVVGIAAISGADQARGYTFGWRPVIAVFVVVASVWSISSLVGPRLPGRVRAACPAIAVGAVAWAFISLSVAIPSAGFGALTHDEPAMHLVALQIDRAGLPHGTVLVRSTGEDLRSLYDGVIDQLDRRGVDVRVDSPFGRVFGDRRTSTPAHAASLWYVTEHGSYRAALLRLPGAHLVASTTPLSAAREAELSRLQAQLWDQLRRAGRTDLLGFVDNPFVVFKVTGVPGVDPLIATRIGRLDDAVQRSGGCRCAVVAVPPRSDYPIASLPVQH
jgi:hypothetical protein